jgi:HK97 family phage major capsid protein
MDATGGIRFLETEVVELSLVTVPANAQATITSIKSLDQAVSGRHSSAVADSLPVVKATKGHPMAQTINEQITAFEHKRAASFAAAQEIQTKVAGEGRSKDPQEREKFDELNAEVKACDAELVDLRDMEKLSLIKATPIATTTHNAVTAAELRGGHVPVVTVKSNVPKGQAYVRYAMALLASEGNKMQALEHAKQWKDSTPEVELLIKAAIAPGTTLDSTWAAPLAVVQPTQEFIELLRPATLIGKMSGFRNVPFNVSVTTQTAGGTYNWVGQGSPKPVGNLQLSTTSLGIAKAAGIVVITQELARVSSPSAEDLVRQDMTEGMAAYLDTQFIDPSIAAVANVSPGSVTNGTTPLTTAGTSPDNARTDLKALYASFVAANLKRASAVFVMSEANAFALGSSLNALGQPLFPGMGPDGGSIFGIPVVTSQSAGTTVAIIDTRGILMADEGGLTIDVSREASVQMDSAPTDPPVAATVVVSLWQLNLIGIKAERFINWKRARLASVKYLVATYV